MKEKNLKWEEECKHQDCNPVIGLVSWDHLQMKEKEEHLKEDELRNQVLKRQAEQIACEVKKAKEVIKRLEEETQKKELWIQEREAALLLGEEELWHQEAEAKLNLKQGDSK